MLQLEASLLWLPMLHFGHIAAFSFAYWLSILSAQGRSIPGKYLYAFKIYGIWLQADRHTHASCNAVPLVWGSLRLAPITKPVQCYSASNIFYCVVNMLAQSKSLTVCGMFSSSLFELAIVLFVCGCSTMGQLSSTRKVIYPYWSNTPRLGRGICYQQNTFLDNLHSEVRPSCLQTTIASVGSHKSSHTVPHCPRKHTSTRPSKLFLPPTSRMSVLLQAVDEVTQV